MDYEEQLNKMTLVFYIREYYKYRKKIINKKHFATNLNLTYYYDRYKGSKNA
jgi:hypothetical protein